VGKQGGTLKYISNMTNTPVADTKWSLGLLGPTFKFASKGFLGISIGFSAVTGTYNLFNGDYLGAGKNGADIGISLYGFFGGAVGLTFGAVYFAIDAFYPGGWPAAIQFNYNLTMHNRAVIPGLNLFRDF
jgi:hypothetical protein